MSAGEPIHGGAAPFVELHQHVDGSIPVAAIWELMCHVVRRSYESDSL